MARKQSDIIGAVVQPFQRFVKIESFSGILLILTTAIALIWANTPLRIYYEQLFGYEFTLQLGNFFDLHKPLILWINDGLMAFFFFVVGLEIKREIITGELSSIKKASLPIFAAIGGMVIPALFFFLFHGKSPGSEGWGIPMATDIAFTLGILSLLGKRVPLGLKIFLTAFAIVDDIGAVLVIAIFYSGQIDWVMLLSALGVFAVLYLLILAGLRSPVAFIIAGGIIWYFFLKSGLHPSITGVMLAFIVPANRKVRLPLFHRAMSMNLNEFCKEDCEDSLLLSKEQLSAVDNMSELVDRVQSPLQSLEHRLHGFVSYFVMPLFALANAGIILGSSAGTPVMGTLSLHIALALVFGKLIGILGFSYLGVRLGLASLPGKSSWIHIAGLSLLGGIGFTMSLFISGLAFVDPVLLNQAKIGILIGSLVAGIGGYLVLRFSLRPAET